MRSFIVFFTTVLTVSGEPPSYLKQCYFNNPDFNKCALENANYAVPFIVKGDRSMDIPPLNPLILPLVEIIQDNFRLALKDLQVIGLDRAVLTDIKLNKTSIDLTIFIDNLQFVGKYEMGGKVLFLTLNGKGPANVTAVDGYYRFVASLGTLKKNNEKYLLYNKPVMDYTLKMAYFKFDDLFNGQEDKLGIDMNKILNDNYEDVLKDIDVPLKETVTSVVHSVVSKLISKLPESYVFFE